MSLEQMIDVFRRSKISLNLSNSISFDVRYFLTSPRGLLNTFRSKKKGEQIKGRHFEIPACKTLQLSNYVEGLEHLFDIGNEIAIFVSPEDLMSKVKFYLSHDDAREAMAIDGYQRILKDHAYSKWFLDIFQKLKWFR